MLGADSLRAHKIYSYRLSNGMTQAEFAQMCNASNEVVAGWEKGVMPDDEHLKKLSEILETPIEKLVGR